MNNAICIIQCRYDSKRLPGKILKELKPGLTCLEYLIKRLGNAKYNVLLATTTREVDDTIIEQCVHTYKIKYPYFLGYYRGEEKNIAKRLYDASEKYDYIIRVTGDDFLVDIDILNDMAEYAIANKLDYIYPKELIRGCDCDIFKREAIKKAMEKYNTTNVESIEFLFQNKEFKTKIYNAQSTYKRTDINLTLDTPDDWKLLHYVWNNLYKINPLFNTWDIVEYFSRNKYLTYINKKPLLTVYTVFKNYPVEWLNEAIESLKIQTFQDFEFILVDYGSDTIATYIKDFNNQEVSRNFFTEKMTFIDSINYVLSKAQGKYILRLDADDVLYPFALEKLIKYIQKNNFYSAVIADHDRMHTDAVEINVSGERDNIMSCALIEKKKYSFVNFLEKQAFRDGTNLLKHFKEYDFQIGYLKETLFKYRIHSNSLTHGTGKEELIKETDALIKGVLG